MVTIKISAPTGETIYHICGNYKIECLEHFLKITDENGDSCYYSYSYLIEIKDWEQSKPQKK